MSRIDTLHLAITYISFMGELISTNGEAASTNNNVTPRKPSREETNAEQQPLNNLVAAAAAGLALRPPHSAYINSIALHHGVGHYNS